MAKGQKPVHIAASSKKVTGRQALWQAIRKVKRFTYDDIFRETHQSKSIYWTYIDSLRKGGYIVAVGEATEPSSHRVHRMKRKSEPRIIFELAKDTGVEAPRLRRDGSPCTGGLRQEQMWRTMKLLPTFTPADLAVAASTEVIGVSAVAAADYVHNLKKAGYLTVIKESKPGIQATYRLTRDTGPMPPMVQRVQTVWDPNLGKIMWQDQVRA